MQCESVHIYAQEKWGQQDWIIGMHRTVAKKNYRKGLFSPWLCWLLDLGYCSWKGSNISRLCSKGIYKAAHRRSAIECLSHLLINVNIQFPSVESAYPYYLNFASSLFHIDQIRCALFLYFLFVSYMPRIWITYRYIWKKWGSLIYLVTVRKQEPGNVLCVIILKRQQVREFFFCCWWKVTNNETYK